MSARAEVSGVDAAALQVEHGDLFQVGAHLVDAHHAQIGDGVHPHVGSSSWKAAMIFGQRIECGHLVVVYPLVYLLQVRSALTTRSRSTHNGR
jgi:hypothetical protein